MTTEQLNELRRLEAAIDLNELPRDYGCQPSLARFRKAMADAAPVLLAAAAENERLRGERCEHCGSDRIYIGPPCCPTCGAPNCCQTCCAITSLEKERDQLRALLTEAVRERDRLRQLCTNVHDRLLRGESDLRLLAMLETGWQGAGETKP